MSQSLAAVKRLRKELQVLRQQQMQREEDEKKKKKEMEENEDGKPAAVGAAAASTAAAAADVDDDIRLQSNPDNILQWTGWIRGPVDTPYEGGVYELSIRCTTDYPLTPPSMKFVTRIFHPNVHFRTGDICLDILKKEWTPAWGIQAACRAVIALLSDPDATSPLNCDAGNMVRGNDMLAYESAARMYAAENASYVSWPPPPDVVAAAFE